MIINNRVVLEKDLIGTLCWFWNTTEVNRKIGILADIYIDEEFPEQTTFYELNGGSFTHCEPANDYDVTFYADRDCSTKGYRQAKRKLIDTIEEKMREEVEYYEDRYKYNEDHNYIDVAIDDKVYYSVLEDDEIVELTKKFMEQM